MVLTLLVAALLCDATHAFAVVSADGKTSVNIDPKTGEISQLQSRQISSSISMLQNCSALRPPAVSMNLTKKAVVVKHLVRCAGSMSQDATITNTFAPNATSITISTTIHALNGTFTVPVTSSINWGMGQLSYWVPWTKGCVKNQGEQKPMCFGKGEWENPLSSEPMPSAPVKYGLGETGAGAVDGISIPMATVLSAQPSNEAASFGGATLLLSPEDPMLEVFLTTDSTSHTFSRQYLRFSTAAPISFSMHIVAHAPPAGFRNGLAFARDAFPRFFLPINPKVAAYEGLGSYSWNLEVRALFSFTRNTCAVQSYICFLTSIRHVLHSAPTRSTTLPDLTHSAS
jgi:hypothetical protein